MDQPEAVRTTPRPVPAWRIELERRERSLGWLARKTGKSTSAVSRYALGTLPTPSEWLRLVEEVLGPVEVGS